MNALLTGMEKTFIWAGLHTQGQQGGPQADALLLCPLWF